MNETRCLLTRLELAAGVPLGADPKARALPAAEPGLHPVSALEDAIRPALERPPCVVSFSGGRDSSVLLAVATRLARREGYELPLPSTLSFLDAPDTEEGSWQEAVVRALGLREWSRRTLGDELDWLGPIAQDLLRRHGVLWPPNSHFIVPMLREAVGGTLLTGVEADGLLGQWRWRRAAAVCNRRTPPRPRDLARVAVALGPEPLRRAWIGWRDPLKLSWLRPKASREVEKTWRAEQAAEPFSWPDRVRWWSQRRYLAVWTQSSRTLAAAEGAAILEPFLSPRFLAAVAQVGGRGGFSTRQSAMEALFGAVVPQVALSRTSKAEFTEAFRRGYTRAFVENWRGEGIPDELVDPVKVRDEWSSPRPHFRSGALLQAAWLAENAGKTC